MSFTRIDSHIGSQRSEVILNLVNGATSLTLKNYLRVFSGWSPKPCWVRQQLGLMLILLFLGGC